MQKVFKRALTVALAIGVLAGCASEEDSIHMAPLPVVKIRSLQKLYGLTVLAMALQDISLV